LYRVNIATQMPTITYIMTVVAILAPIKNAELEGIYTLWDSSIDPSLGLGVCWSEPVPKNIQDPIFWVWGSTVSVLVLGIGEFKPAKGTLQSTCLPSVPLVCRKTENLL